MTVIAQPLIVVRDVEASSRWFCTGHTEIWIRDPDGYVVVLASFPQADPDDG